MKQCNERQSGATPSARREFLLSALKLSGQIAVVQTGLHAVSLMTGGGRFGGLTAGAKVWTYLGNNSPCIDFPIRATEGAPCTFPAGTRRGPPIGTGSSFCRELECR